MWTGQILPRRSLLRLYVVELTQHYCSDATMHVDRTLLAGDRIGVTARQRLSLLNKRAWYSNKWRWHKQTLHLIRNDSRSSLRLARKRL